MSREARPCSRLHAYVLSTAAVLTLAAPAVAQSPFTYQGQLRQNGAAANGNFTISFALFDAAAGGNQIGATLVANISVTDGVFTRELDFGADVFVAGQDRWLEIKVNANPPMAPRAKVNPAPEAHAARAIRLPFGVVVNLAGPACVFEITNNGTGPSICGTNTSATGTGVVGKAAGAGRNIGVHGRTESRAANASGVYGESVIAAPTAMDLATNGVYGFNDSGASNATGVYGLAFANTGNTKGVWGDTKSTTDFASGVLGRATTVTAFGKTFGVRGETASTTADAAGVFGESAGGKTFGVRGQTSSNATDAAGVFGKSTGGATFGVYGTTSSNNVNSAGVFGNYTDAAGNGAGVWGRSESANGYGGYFSTTGGGTALWANGKCRAQCVQIDGGCDVAEPFAVTNDGEAAGVQPGMIVSIDPKNPGRVRLAAEPYDSKVAGIISGANGVSPGMVLQGDPGSNALGEHPVALTGRVYAWCDASYGAIAPGDRLTTSATPGHAMRVSDAGRAPGAVIGKAMSTLPEGRGFVLVLVQPQ